MADPDIVIETRGLTKSFAGSRRWVASTFA
jgi:hypothetical protein